MWRICCSTSSGLTADEKEIILDGCLMNYYAQED